MILPSRLGWPNTTISYLIFECSPSWECSCPLKTEASTPLNWGSWHRRLKRPQFYHTNDKLGLFSVACIGILSISPGMCRSTTPYRFCSMCPTFCTSAVSLHVHRTRLMLSENISLIAHIDCTVKATKVLPDSSRVWDLRRLKIISLCKYRKSPNVT